MARYWFKPKTYGYGATPVTWQGWVVTLGAAAVLVQLAFVFIAWPAQAHTGPGLAGLLVWAGLEAMVIVGLIAIGHAKTDGEWNWRWGGKK